MQTFKSVLGNLVIIFLALGLVSPIAVMVAHNFSIFDFSIPTVQAITKAPVLVKRPASVTQISIGVPVRIKIPSIGVNSAIERVALTTDGSMGVPKIPLDTAWYELGPRPGETGSATISGHVDWWDGSAAVFAKLNKLKSGDKIIVVDDKGVNISFVITGIRNYNAAADATDVFISNDGGSHLNLITCGGVWNKRAKQYTKRLVVFADKV